MDPLVGVPGGPATLHDYAYAHNDPVQVTDPTGMFGAIGAGLSVALGSFGMATGYYNSAKQPTGMHIANVVRQSMIINYFVTALEEYSTVGHTMKKAAKYERDNVRTLYKNAPQLTQNLRTKIKDAFKVLGGDAFREVVNEAWDYVAEREKKHVIVPYKLNGFPDFSAYIYHDTLTGVTRRDAVQFLRLLGDRDKDFSAANTIVRLYRPTFSQPRTPGRYSTVWHHHEVVGIMMLVERVTHPSWNGVQHSGGGAYYDIINNKAAYGIG